MRGPGTSQPKQDRDKLLEIFLDGDACPVKDEVERVASRHGLPVHIISNGGLRPSRNPQFHHVLVAAGPDAADDWIAEHIGANDIAVTSDLPLAARCIAKGAIVLNAKGEAVTDDRIGMALGLRDLNRHLREVTGRETPHAAFGNKDRSRFLGALENAIQAIRRSSS
jgi:uncharacterized protein YaiI (UPF0178 family)